MLVRIELLIRHINFIKTIWLVFAHYCDPSLCVALLQSYLFSQNSHTLFQISVLFQTSRFEWEQTNAIAQLSRVAVSDKMVFQACIPCNSEIGTLT